MANIGAAYYLDEAGAAGDGTTDDSSVIQTVVNQAATDGAPVITGPKSYAIGTRVDIPQGVWIYTYGSTFIAHSSLPTSTETSALFKFDGTAASSNFRGNAMIGAADFDNNGRALYGILIEGGQSRLFIEGHPFRFVGSDTYQSIIRANANGWWFSKFAGIYATNCFRDGAIGFDYRDDDGTTLLLEMITIATNNATSTATRGMRLEAETIEMHTVLLEQTPPGAYALELSDNNIGTNLQAFNTHFEANDGRLILLPASTGTELSLKGGVFRVPSTNTEPHLIQVGADAIFRAEDVRIASFNNHSALGNVDAGGKFRWYEGERQIGSGSLAVTGTGEKFQMWDGVKTAL